MEGSRTRSKDIYYRCRVCDAVPGVPSDHPTNVMFREDWLTGALDTWISEAFAADKVEETVEAMFSATEPTMADLTRRQVVDRRLAESESKLQRFKDALAAGADPHLVVAWINEAQKDITHARAEQDAMRQSATVGPTREELKRLVGDFTDLAGRLGRVPDSLRAEIYSALGVRLTYDPSTASVEAEVSPPHQMLGKTSVRGGT